MTIASNVAGAALKLDDQPVASGTKVLAVAGMKRKLEAVTSLVLDGTTYHFVAWSDGGRAGHRITVPLGDKTYTAKFRIAKAQG
jgi:hypothetical protein